MTAKPTDDPESVSAAMPSQIEAKFAEGWASHQSGRLAEAWTIYQDVITRAPSHFNALHLAGIVAAQIGRIDEAPDLIRRAIDIDGTNAGIHYNLGCILATAQRHRDAVESFDKAIALKPDYAEAYYARANIFSQLNQHESAVESYRHVIRLKPEFVEAYNNLGVSLRELKQPLAAIEIYDKAIQLHSGHSVLFNNRGIAFFDLEQHEVALASYNRAILLDGRNARAHNNRGIVLSALKQYDAALASYDKAIQIDAGFLDAYNNRGLALNALKQHRPAIDNYNMAIQINPNHPDAYNNRGVASADLKLHDAALSSYDAAIAIRPDYAAAYNNRGNLLQDLRQFSAALTNYDSALRFDPNNAAIYNNRGAVLLSLKEFRTAIESFDHAIRLKPDYAEAHNNRGHAFRELKQYQAALESYENAFRLEPEFEFLYGVKLHTQMHLCDWRDIDRQISELIGQIAHNKPCSNPFSVLAFTDSLSIHGKAAHIWANKKYPSNAVLGVIPGHPPRDKIRVGYFSMDFRVHAVAFLIAGIIEAHNRDRFEIYGFCFGPKTGDEMQLRLETAFDHFIHVEGTSAWDIAALARSMNIDIAVDLAGHTTDSRTEIFATRAAPIQVNYLGYPGTMGANYMDYLMADKTVIPEGDRDHFVEKIVYLPNSYQPNDDKRRIADRVFTREELGLPQSAFVFCCFNNSFKITPSTFDSWMKILKQVDGSVLWLLEDSPMAADNLRREAALRGVSGDRLVFASRVTQADHLARHRAADLFIDTSPYNAHTTAGDALWAGLPVLTCAGSSFASRVAASLLAAINLPELITLTKDDYESLAVKLAKTPDLLKSIRHKLNRNRLSAPLFDTQKSAMHIEEAFEVMYRRYHTGAKSDHIEIGS